MVQLNYYRIIDEAVFYFYNLWHFVFVICDDGGLYTATTRTKHLYKNAYRCFSDDLRKNMYRFFMQPLNIWWKTISQIGNLVRRKVEFSFARVKRLTIFLICATMTMRNKIE